MNEIGYEPRVFSVIESSFRSISRVVGVDDDVLEDRAEHLRRRVDLRLAFGREVDDLRVAPALEVEDAVVGPAVLVVTDQRARRVGRQRRLARAGQSEEDRRVSVVGHVRRAVHREHVAQRQQVVHDGEHRLLHLAGVARPADDRLVASEVAGSRTLRSSSRRSPGRPSRSARAAR